LHLDFSKGLINAPGFLGFAPAKERKALSRVLDAFVSNPISYLPRKSAEHSFSKQLKGSQLLHSGWPNAGLARTVDRFAMSWERSKLPIILCLMESDPGRLSKMVVEFEGMGNIAAIEILLGEDFSSSLMMELCSAGLGELPLLANVAMTRIGEVGRKLMDADVDALVMGPARAHLEDDDVISGRLYGPAQFPLALEICKELEELDIPFIGGNGIYRVEQAKEMLAVGAKAVQLDAALWKANFDAGNWLDIRKDG
jgi:dihydroorotate dehydrogenase